MKTSVIIATYGDREWGLRGSMLAKEIDPAAHEVIALHERAGTLASTRNLAASAATGDWLVFLDADDSLDGFYFSAMAEATLTRRILHAPVVEDRPYMEPPDELLVPAISFVAYDGRCTDPVIPAWDRSIYDVNCAVIGTMIPRRLFTRVGGFDEWTAYEDWELWLRCIAAGAKLVPVPEAVYCARAEDGTGRNTNGDHRREYDRIRARHAGVAPAVWGDAKVHR